MTIDVVDRSERNDATLHSVWGTSASNVWASGTSGTLLHGAP